MSKLDTENQVIEGVTFFYAKINKPSLKYQSETDKEFTVDVLVDKATAKNWSKSFPKQKPRELDAEEFGEKFGTEHLVDGVDEYYLIKLKKPANYRDKETGVLKDIPDQYRPRVFLDDGNGELEDITFTKLVGNGSKGVVQYEVNTNSFGTFGKLLAIKVDELVVVEQGDSAGKFNVLGKVKSLAENPNVNSTPNAGNDKVAKETTVAETVDADSEW